MDVLPTPGFVDPAPLSPKRRAIRLRRTVREIWLFSAAMAAGLSVLAFAMTGDFLLSFPVVAVCGVAALAGTASAPRRSRDPEESGRDRGFFG